MQRGAPHSRSAALKRHPGIDVHMCAHFSAGSDDCGCTLLEGITVLHERSHDACTHPAGQCIPSLARVDRLVQLTTCP